MPEPLRRDNLPKSVKRKKRDRRRPTGERPMIGVRLSTNELARLDRWATTNGYTRSEAIRVLGCVLVNAQEGGSPRAQGTGRSETSRTCWSATFRRIAVAA
jgi:hypothetical protein